MKNLIILVFCATFFLVDMYTDWREGIPVSHIWHEGVLFLLALLAIGWQIQVIIKKNKRIKDLHSELLDMNQSYLKWKEKAQSSSQQMRNLIDNEFNSWQLSHSEKDVALLLIKGLSMKQIAEIRETQEKTIRQQATGIYRKSGLSGRQELAAFFLEDILSQPINPL